MSKTRGLLALVRASIALSAAADGVAGLALAVAAGADPPTPTLVLIPLISLLLFTAAHLSYWGWAHPLVAAFGGLVLIVLYSLRDLGAAMLALWLTDAVGFPLG